MIDQETKLKIKKGILLAHNRLNHMSLDPKLRGEQEKEILEETFDLIYTAMVKAKW